MRTNRLLFAAALLLCAIPAFQAHGAVAVRLKDIARIEEVRGNQLYGIGLVIGLNATGDGGKLAPQLAGNMLEKLRVTIPDADLSSDNIAAVMVTSEAAPFITEGSKIDIIVSSIGDATSLEGGTLLQTPLQGADGIVYAVAQGPLSTGSFSASGEAASVRKNHPTVGRIPGGAIMERRIPTLLRPTDDLSLVLNTPDFTTAVRTANAIDEIFTGAAHPVNAGQIKITVPKEYRAADRLAFFVARIQEIKVTPDSPARVVVNERTGTIVAGENVRLGAAAVSHGNLTIAIRETTNTSQPNPFGGGETTTEKSTDIVANEERNGIFVVEDAATLAEVARALNLLGVSPRDMVSIFQALREAGALQCELIII